MASRLSPALSVRLGIGINVNNDFITLSYRHPIWAKQIVLRRGSVADVRYALGKLRFCSTQQRTLAAVDCCGKGDMRWLAEKLRQVLGLAPPRVTLWQNLRDWLSLRRS